MARPTPHVYTLTFVDLGTCQLKFHASGKNIEANDFTIDISPDLIPDMPGYLIDECIHRNQGAGFVIHHFNRTVERLEQSDTEIPGEPGNLFIRKGSMIMNHFRRHKESQRQQQATIDAFRNSLLR